MAIKYSYKPRYKNRIVEFAGKNSRSIGLSLLAVALIFSFSLLSDRITGFVTYASDLESRLNETLQQLNAESRLRAECEAYLNSTKANLNTCSDKLTSSQSYLTTCEKERSDLKSYSNQLNSLFSSCDTERADFKSKYANETENYKKIVRSSVRAICCSFGDSATGTVRSWGIESNHIVCYGNFSVNCTNGNTNY